eukprot:2317747-Pleurochrysis_carterae.AAC.2
MRSGASMKLLRPLTAIGMLTALASTPPIAGLINTMEIAETAPATLAVCVRCRTPALLAASRLERAA